MTGTPASSGTATALVTPGTTSTGTPAAAQASTSSIPRPNTNGSPPLSRTTVRPAARVPDQQVVDRLLRGEPAARHLGHVDHLDVLAKPVQHGQRREPVDQDDVRLGQPLVAAPGQQAGVARTAADQHHPAPGPGGRLGSARRPCSSASTAASAASRSATERRGSRPDSTATVAGPVRAVAGVHAVAPSASSAREHQIRRARRGGDDLPR